MADAARAHFGLRPDLPVLLVTGGSQGASSLNRAVAAAAPAMRHAGVQVLHIVGPRAAADMPGPDTAAPESGVPYRRLGYVDRMDLAYAAADFALCRAGAMTCAELSAVGLPAAYVPLPHGNGEQRLNARPIERAGGGLIIDDASLTPEWVSTVLLGIVLDPELVTSMSHAAASVGNREAGDELAEAVLDVIRRGKRPARATLRGGRTQAIGARLPGLRAGQRPSAGHRARGRR
jgi:UDP-N-acetylglucosamine--N-acetylmuramyl-(pentapeptide) pyrophosphoryl-undecaprenol N-acetylglucosamine transferase